MKTYLLILLSAVLLGSAAAQAQPADIRVASYNLRMDTESDSLNAWPHRKDDVKALIRYHGFDIIGTQEAFLHQLQGLLEMPEYAYFGAGRDDGKDAGEHSAIIYRKDRFAVVDSGNFWLSETPDTPGLGWDATCCNRIASWVKFNDRQSGKSFYFFNVHFDHQGVVARRESGKLMVAKIAEIAQGEPAICTGDFNSTPDTEQIQLLSDALQDAYTATQMPPYGPEGTFTGFRLNVPLKNRIDYVFVSNQFTVLTYAALTDTNNWRFPSDHLPVVADVRLGN